MLALQETTQWLWLSMLGNLEIMFSVGGSMGYQESTMKGLAYQNILMSQCF